MAYPNTDESGDCMTCGKDEAHCMCYECPVCGHRQDPDILEFCEICGEDIEDT